MTEPTNTVPTENLNAIAVRRDLASELVACDQQIQTLEDEKTDTNKTLNDKIKKLKKQRRTLLGEINQVDSPQRNIFIEGVSGAPVVDDGEEDDADADGEGGAEPNDAEEGDA